MRKKPIWAATVATREGASAQCSGTGQAAAFASRWDGCGGRLPATAASRSKHLPRWSSSWHRMVVLALPWLGLLQACHPYSSERRCPPWSWRNVLIGRVCCALVETSREPPAPPSEHVFDPSFLLTPSPLPCYWISDSTLGHHQIGA